LTVGIQSPDRLLLGSGPQPITHSAPETNQSYKTRDQL